MYSTVQLNKFMTLSISLKQTIITTLVNKSTCTLFLVGCEKFFQKKMCKYFSFWQMVYFKKQTKYEWLTKVFSFTLVIHFITSKKSLLLWNMDR